MVEGGEGVSEIRNYEEVRVKFWEENGMFGNNKMAFSKMSNAAFHIFLN